MKSLRQLAVLTAVFCVTTVVALPPASAEEARREAVVGEATAVVSQEQLCRLVRQCREGQGSEACREARAGARAAWRRLLNRLSLYEGRIEQLESRVGGLADRDRTLEGQLNTLRGQVVELQRALAELSELGGRVGLLEQQMELEAAGHNRLRERVTELERRIAAAERRDGYLVYGPVSGGFLGIWSADGRRFTAAQIGLGTVRLRLTDQVQIFVDLGLVAAWSERPIGTYVRGGLRLEFPAHGRLGVEIAVGGTWAGLSAGLQAQAAFLMLEPSLTWSPRRASWLEAFVTVPIGMALDGEEPNWAGGFVTGFRVTTRSF